jgi:hypothetical protein
MRGRLRSLRGERGQALPVAVAVLALGAILVTPALEGAGTSNKAANSTGRQMLERYSMDAGIEWSGWRLIGDPELTTDTSFSSTPLEPLPATINGGPFPQTEIRFVAAAGGVEALAPVWQGGGGARCYAFSASDEGTLSVRIDVDSGQVWAALLPGAAACVLPGGTPPLTGGSPFGADFSVAAAGAYQLLVAVDTATTGTVEMSVPAATYEVRSMVGTRSAVARVVAGHGGVRVVSWQLN